jgi:F-type H+-transporting ATPase subunit g
VALALLKQVYRAERLAPPTSFAQVRSAYTTLWGRAKDINYWRDLFATGGWKKVAVGGLEVYGIFKIGEIIGKRSLVGYDVE